MHKSSFYDLIKILTMILVVIGHVTRMFTGYGIVNINRNFIISGINSIIYGFHMPLFMLISVSVYYMCINDLNKYQNKKEFIIQKFKRLIVPYFIFGCFYVAPVMVAFSFTNQSYIDYIISGILLMKNNRHLWFLIYLFIYFVFSHFIFLKLHKYTKLIIMIMLIIISFCNIDYLSDILYYFLFFTLGYVLNKYYSNITRFIKKYKFQLLILIPIYLLLIYINNSIMNYITAIIGICIFLDIVYNFFSEYAYNIINKLKKYSMGIYLFHPMIIYILFLYLPQYISNDYIIAFLIFILSFCTSQVLTFIIRKFKLQFIFGEKVKVKTC